MTQMSVGEFKARFSYVVDLIRNGEEIEVLYGRSKKPIARVVPTKPARRDGLLGCLAGKAGFEMSDDWDLTPEGLFDI